MSDLLIEIGTEELPAKGLEALSQAFGQRVTACLEKAELTFTQIKCFASPRRLALLVSELSPFQPDRMITKRGPAQIQAYDSEGKPTEVLLRFAKACNTEPEKLKLQETPKGAWVVLEQKETGKSAEVLIPAILQDALNTLPLPKRMRWDSLEESFIRPIHWVVLMLDNKRIPAKYFNIDTGIQSRGHRFHCEKPIEISKPNAYEDDLYAKGQVIVDFQKRKASIQSQIKKICEQQNIQPILEENLLEEVTGLVEWPVVLLGNFSPEFLELPREALITSMQVHQKCFPVENTEGKVLAKFFITSNIASLNPQSVIEGNERVMKARLADAVFYYRKDKETTLESRRDSLKKVIFQQGLGSLWDKSNRIAKLAAFIAPLIGADEEATRRAAELCKTDLLTDMVGEFPELQGIMGKYYAKNDKESEVVASAIQEHYLPRFAQDSLPESKEGIAIALADRIDTLVGLFGLGKRPTGDKDPFALRRQAFAVLRLMVEKELKLDLLTLINESANFYVFGALELSKEPKTAEMKMVTFGSGEFFPELMDFCFERLRAWTQESDISTRVFDAVLEKRPTSPYDFHRRLLAVNSFKILPEAESLAQANKRVRNILAKTDVPSGDIDLTLLNEDAEKNLMTALVMKETEVAPLIEQKQYEAALQRLAALKDPVDAFFDKVMVMVEDLPLRDNRLKLLNRLRALFLEIADISVL